MATKAPKFLNKNLITAVSQITSSATTTDAYERKIYDRNEATQWVSLGETSGTSTITWTPTAATAVTRILIQNCNWKTFTIKYNTSVDFSTPISISNSTHENFYFEFNSVSVTNIVISITDTHTASDTRRVGQIIMTTEIFEFAENYFWTIQHRGGGKSLMKELSDGTFFKTFVRDANNYAIALQNVSASERDNFKTVYDLNKKQAVVFVPNPKTQTDEWDGLANHYNWGNQWDAENWYRDLEANGYIGNIELYQAAGVA